jgi:AraC family transcriptional regulator
MTTSHRTEPVAASSRRVRTAGMNSAAGRIYWWQGGSLWIGEGTGRTQWHEHHAHQLALAPQGHFRFRTEAEGGWTRFEGAIVPSHCTHQFEVDGITLVHLFVEPESRAGRALTARFGPQAITEVPAALARPVAKGLFDALARNPSADAMVKAAQAAIATLCGDSAEPDKALDKRLVRALEYIQANVRNPLSLGEVASAVALSESRFRHLFVAGTGSSFRAYLLWLRINLAIDAAMAGASWTDAAHAAGFADSAHLTRTHKRMFGIEPTAVRPQAFSSSS